MIKGLSFVIYLVVLVSLCIVCFTCVGCGDEEAPKKSIVDQRERTIDFLYVVVGG